MKHIEAMKQARELAHQIVCGNYDGNAQEVLEQLDQAIATEESSATQEADTWYTVFKAVSAAIEQCKNASGMTKSIDAVVNATQITHDWMGTDTQPKVEQKTKREWVGLTDDEVRQMCGSVPSMKDAVREAEAKLKEKNK